MILEDNLFKLHMPVRPVRLYKSFCHHLYLQGCRAPLVVKFADTQKDKEMKKLQQMNANLLSVASLAGLGNISPQYLAVSIGFKAASSSLLP